MCGGVHTNVRWSAHSRAGTHVAHVVGQPALLVLHRAGERRERREKRKGRHVRPTLQCEESSYSDSSVRRVALQ
eukprot:147421-Rhodomonas_salina.1